MGNGRWDAKDWGTYSAQNVAGKTQSQIFSSSSLQDQYNPTLVTKRESRDSEKNPNSTPIIIGSDVTGSMGMIAEKLLRQGLNTVVTEIYDRKPVSDPHIMVAAIGDVQADRAPLQVTQFEADITIAKQAADLWLEGGGGGNNGESYILTPLFAAMKVSADAIEKAGRKGYIFTVGDEQNHPVVSRHEIKRALGIEVEADLKSEDIVSMVGRNWHYFHIVLINEGECSWGYRDRNVASWKQLLGERVIQLEDVGALAETIVSLIQVTEGANAKDVAASWSGSTAVAVANAIGGVPAMANGQGKTGLRRLTA